jgi:hypothetical protein
MDGAGVGEWGQVWTEAGMGLTTLALAASPNQNVIYALSAENSPGQYYNGLHAVYKSTLSGASGSWAFTVRNTDINQANTLLLSSWAGCGPGYPDYNLGWYNNVIAVDPSSADIVWVGGVDLARSSNGGVAWGRASAIYVPNQPGVSTHFDQHAIAFSGSGATSAMFVGNDGGVYQATNRLNAVDSTCPDYSNPSYPTIQITWSPVNAGYGVTQFYQGIPYWSSTFAATASCLGGTQDNGGLQRESAGLGWTEPFGGDAGFAAADTSTTSDPNVGTASLYLGIGTDYTGSAAIQLSTDGGYGWINAGPSSFPGKLFVAPIAQDPARSQWLWTGGSQLYRRDSIYALDWAPASAAFTGLAAVSAIAVSAFSSDYVLVGLSDGRIARSTSARTTTATTSWSTQQVEPNQRFCSSIAFDPNDFSGSTAYATFSGFNISTLWKSSDAFNPTGPHWTAVTAFPVAVPANWVAVDATKLSRLYVATDIGVFTSTDGGTTWMVETTGFPQMRVESLAQNRGNHTGGQDSYLYAFSHGRGAYNVQTAYLPGDASQNGTVDVADVFYLINGIFAGGPKPPLWPADVDGNGVLNVADIFYLINYLFAGGPPPQSPSGSGGSGSTGTPGASPSAIDTISVGQVATVTRTGAVRVPVYFKDASGTPIGMDRPAGQKITQLAFQVTFDGNPCVTGLSFDETTGILNGLPTSFHSTGGATELIAASIPFTLDGNDKIGDAVLTLSACPATAINISLATTGLIEAFAGCDQCPPTQPEQARDGSLAVVGGSITFVTDGASFVSQIVPTTMTHNAQYSVSVVMKNTGTSTWTDAAGYLLQSQNPIGNQYFQGGRIRLPANVSVPPNQSYTFRFTVTAPSTLGNYNFQYRMLDGTTNFGSFSTNVVVHVI